MTEELIQYSVDDRGIALLQLDRAPVNALSLSMYEALSTTAARLDADRNVKVGILTAKEPTRVFCAGADLHELVALEPEDRLERHQRITHTWKDLAAIAVPMICAVNGAAIGGGFGLAAMCDIRIAGEGAVFSMPETRRGTVGGGGAFGKKIGLRPGTLREIHFTGRKYTASEALQLGMIDHLVADSDVQSAAVALAAEIAENERAALVLTKRALDEVAKYSDWAEGYLATHGLSQQMAREPFVSEHLRAALSHNS